MRTDVINSYEWLIFDERELEQARTKVAEGHSSVLVETKCCECGLPIHATVDQIDNHEKIKHTDAWHDAQGL